MYGRALHPLCKPGPRERDTFELEILSRTIQDKKPFLGICRGAQLLNIGCGGTMYQDVSEFPVSEDHTVAGYSEIESKKHPVLITHPSRTYDLLGRERITVNTGHHQFMDSIGNGLSVSGTSPAGIVEIIESADPEHFCIGVQSHPEATSHSDLEPIFVGFAQAVSAHQEKVQP
jgi:putative glutamine amidotransferase